MLLPTFALENVVIQDIAIAVLLSGAISTGTWYVAPPILLDLISKAGFAFSRACSNASKGFVEFTFFANPSSALYTIFLAIDFLPSYIILLINLVINVLEYNKSGSIVLFSARLLLAIIINLYFLFFLHTALLPALLYRAWMVIRNYPDVT